MGAAAAVDVEGQCPGEGEKLLGPDVVLPFPRPVPQVLVVQGLAVVLWDVKRSDPSLAGPGSMIVLL